MAFRSGRAAAAVLGLLVAGALTPVPARAAQYRPADTGATVQDVTWLEKGREFDITVRSKALAGDYKVRVLVPKTWRADSRRTWPVLYAYHGGRDVYTSWTRETDIEGYAAEYDVMVVMPAADSGFYTDWYNGGRGGTPRWETWHLTEVRQLVERNFHAGRVRACVGISSGGQGCMTYAARHPGTFRYAGSFSGPLSILAPGMPAIMMVLGAVQGNRPLRIWGDPVTDRANWEAHDPLTLAGRLRGTRIHFTAGTTGRPIPEDTPKGVHRVLGQISEPPVGHTNILFRDRLRELGIPFTSHIYADGMHAWASWIREVEAVWPDLMRTIGARRL